MLLDSLKERTLSVWRNRPLAVGVGLLLVGQLLCMANVYLVYALGLIYVLVLILPYPAVIRSLPARAVVAFLVAFSLLQVLAALQLFMFPLSDFRLLSALVSALVLLVAWLRQPVSAKLKVLWWDQRDVAALVAVLCFVLPLTGLCFWKVNPVHLTYVGGIQSPDGAAHFVGISQMAGEQHLDYEFNGYYPKGFHIASAFMLEAVHATQRETNWVGNARVFFGLYILWGALLMYLLFYTAAQWLQALVRKPTVWLWLLVALTLGLTASIFYLLPFTYDGFLNYYYVATAVILGALYLYGYKAAASKQWPMVLYLLLTFGVGMSWGPLLTPALLLIGAVYALPAAATLTGSLRKLLDWRYWPTFLAFALQIVPLYIHFRFAKLTEAQGINAEGIIRDFHFGIVLIGLALLLGLLVYAKTTDTLRRQALYVMTPFYILLGVLLAEQYFAVGDLRYYAIKTSYLLELFVLVLIVTLIARLVTARGLSLVEQWLAMPALTFVAVALLIGVSGANPLLPVRQLFRHVNNFGEPAFYTSDVVSFTQLALAGSLDGQNVADMHYDASIDKIYGDALLTNWTDAMLPVGAGVPAAADCTRTLFEALAYGTGQPSEQPSIRDATKRCIGLAAARGVPYYIVTDQQSLPYLQRAFGSAPTYVANN